MHVVIGSVNSVGLFSFLRLDQDQNHDNDQGVPPNKPRPLDPASREPPSGGGGCLWVVGDGRKLVCAGPLFLRDTHCSGRGASSHDTAATTQHAPAEAISN